MRPTFHRAVVVFLPLCLLTVACSSTLRAHEIQLLDENGQERMTLMGTKTGGFISVYGDDDDRDDATLNIGVIKAGKDHQGPTTVCIQAESGKAGFLSVNVDPSGAHLYMGTNATDGFQITSDENGLMVVVDPKGSSGLDAKASELAQAQVTKEARGVRITLDKGRIVVRDLAGHEIAVVPDPAPTAASAPR